MEYLEVLILNRIKALEERLAAVESTISSVTPLSGAGSPEGVVEGLPGRIYVQTDAPGVLWSKTSGTGSTGWAANS